MIDRFDHSCCIMKGKHHIVILEIIYCNQRYSLSLLFFPDFNLSEIMASKYSLLILFKLLLIFTMTNSLEESRGFSSFFRLVYVLSKVHSPIFRNVSNFSKLIIPSY